MCAAFTWFCVFCNILHTLIFAYSLHADAWVFFFFCLFLVVLCLRHYWCLFVDPLCICVFCVSLKCFCSCCGLCLFLVFAISCGAFFSLWCRSQDETWGLPGFLLRVLRLPTTAVSVWCGCKVDEAFQGIKQKDAWKVLWVISKSRKASDEVICDVFSLCQSETLDSSLRGFI